MPPPPQVSEAQDPMFLLNEVNSRTRILENKYSLMGERLLIINQNMIEEYKRSSKELQTITKDISNLKKDLEEIKNTLRHIVQEMSTFAKKENVKTIEKYINILNPLNFVTEEQVLKLLKEKKGDKTGRK